MLHHIIHLRVAGWLWEPSTVAGQLVLVAVWKSQSLSKEAVPVCGFRIFPWRTAGNLKRWMFRGMLRQVGCRRNLNRIILDFNMRKSTHILSACQLLFDAFSRGSKILKRVCFDPRMFFSTHRWWFKSWAPSNKLETFWNRWTEKLNPMFTRELRRSSSFLTHLGAFYVNRFILHDKVSESWYGYTIHAQLYRHIPSIWLICSTL